MREPVNELCKAGKHVETEKTYVPGKGWKYVCSRCGQLILQQRVIHNPVRTRFKGSKKERLAARKANKVEIVEEKKNVSESV